MTTERERGARKIFLQYGEADANGVRPQVEFEAVFRESHDNTTTVTQHPIEVGAEIADHAYNNPKIYTLEAGISNTPLVSEGEQAVGADIYGTGRDRMTTAWSFLQGLNEARQLVNMQTGLELLENLIITGLSTTRDPQTANVLFFTAVFQQVFLTSTRIVTLSQTQLNDLVRDKASNIDRGTQQKTQSKTILNSFLGGN